MAIRNIVTEGDPVLEKPTRRVEKFDGRLHQLLDDMTETLKQARGAGIAAPQVGVLKQVCIVDADEEQGVIELINPEIIYQEGEQNGAEGCLSFPGEFGLVKRPMKVRVKAQNRDGKSFEITGEGFSARAMSHEIDHLNGVLFVSKVSRMLTEEELETGEYNLEEDEL